MNNNVMLFRLGLTVTAFSLEGLSVIGGLDYWNGLLEWPTGMDFDLFFFLFFSSQELTI